MPRDLELGRGIFVLPFSFVARVEREIDASEPTVLVVYPDDTNGQELAAIVEASARLAETQETHVVRR